MYKYNKPVMAVQRCFMFALRWEWFLSSCFNISRKEYRIVKNKDVPQLLSKIQQYLLLLEKDCGEIYVVTGKTFRVKVSKEWVINVNVKDAKEMWKDWYSIWTPLLILNNCATTIAGLISSISWSHYVRNTHLQKSGYTRIYRYPKVIW